MVMEYSMDGSLFDNLKKKADQKISEKEAAIIIFQISHAINYLH